MDGSQTLDPIEAKPDSIAVRTGRTLLVIPRTIVFLCNVWISAFMWATNMEWIKFILPRSYRETDAGGGTTQTLPEAAVEVEPTAVAHDVIPPTQDGELPQPERCDYCLASETDKAIIRCPANHVVCADCFPRHTETRVVCLSPSGCELGFTVEALESLDQEDLLNTKGVFVSQSDGESTDEEYEEAAEDLVKHEGSDEEQWAGAKLEDNPPETQIDAMAEEVRVKVEDVVPDIPAEAQPQPEPAPPIEEELEAEFVVSSISHRVKLGVRFAPGAKLDDEPHTTSNWPSNVPPGSITAPPAPRYPKRHRDPGPSAPAFDDFYQSDSELDEPRQAPATAPPFPTQTKQKSKSRATGRGMSKPELPAPGTDLRFDELQKTFERAKKDRKNAQARRITGETNFAKGKWPREELNKRNEECDAAEAAFEAAQRAREEYLTSLSPRK